MLIVVTCQDICPSLLSTEIVVLYWDKWNHTTTGCFQSHPHFTEENKYAFVCLNILNIL